MVKVYVFIAGISAHVDGPLIWSAVALTEKGKWITGSISLSETGALNGCADLAKRLAKGMLSSPYEVVITDMTDPAVKTALKATFGT